MAADRLGDALAPLERPRPLAQQAYDSIRAELMSGRWGPDERLTEQDVARRLSISRTPAREALRRLVLMGSLDALPGGGYVQRTLTARDVREHCELRLVLEPDAAALAAAREGPELDALLASDDLRRPALDPAHDMRLHVAIAETSGNEVLAGLVRTLNERAAVHRLYGDGYDERVRARLAEGHTAIVAALEARDPAAAFAAMTEHLRLEQEMLGLEPLDA
jgi:DNA-binding GntR family transcriptional regulator